ncbi:TonB-dependent receptor [Brevundimonas sp. BH3]|uniref:TonB-dependent receptor n=1 Tax=Brevundimonas sp. BH3 TaxID=3133089 RepID=UPI00324C7D97
MFKTRFKLVLLCSSAAIIGGAYPALAHADTALTASVEMQNRVVGVVTNAEGTNFLVGAEVRIPGQDQVAVTDREGRFSLHAPAGQHNVVVSYFGRQTQQVPVRIAEGEVARIAVAMPIEAASSVEDVVVTGRRPQAESEAAALQIQRASTSLVNVVSADGIGNFPDQNIAAALSRLPGVAVERDQGQERAISLRGAPSRWATLSFDGLNVVSPGGKRARTDTIPAAIAKTVTIRKAVTADMSGETLAGNIDISTRGAFDYPDRAVSLNLGYGYNDLGGGTQHDLSAFVADTFADGKFGAALSFSTYEREMVTDNFETDWESASEDREAGSETRFWADAHQNKLYRLTRSNTAYAGRFDYRPSDEHRFYFSSIYTEFTDDEMRNAHEFDFDDNAIRTSAGATRGYADIRTGNTPMKGTIYGVELDSSLNINHTVESIFTNTLGGDHFVKGWDVSWRLNYTQSQAESGPSFNSSWRSPRPNGVIDYSQRPTVIYDYTNRDQHGVQLFDTIVNPDGTFSMGAFKRSLDPQDYEFVNLRSTARLQDSESISARIDLTRELELFGRSTELKFGGQYDSRTKTDERTTLEILPAMLAGANVPMPSPADFAINDPYKGDMPLGYAFRYFSEKQAKALWGRLHEQGLSRVQPGVSETNNYEVSEDVIAAYAMTTTYFDWGNLVLGVRAEQVQNEGSALVNFGNGFEPVMVGDDNLVILPSAHLNWDINEQMKLRVSVNTGAARPDYSLLRPNFELNDEDMEISGGNPSAGPEKAIGADAYLEWYMPSGAFFSVGAYYKHLQDVLFDVEYSRYGRDDLNSGGINRSDYTYFTTDNGGEGYLAGVEFAFSQTLEPFAERLNLPDWASGFGLRGNVTLNTTETETPDGRKVALPGSSDFIYNIAASYERYSLSTSLSWQYRTEWLDSLGDGDALGDSFWDEVGRLDFKVSYAFNDRAEVYFDANNLLNEPGIRYQGDRMRVSEYESFGARYMMGLRLNF